MSWDDGLEPFLDEDTQAIRSAARTFAEEKVLPHAAAIDREHRFPQEIISQLGELGFLGMLVPEQYGGAGLTALSYALSIEELASACASTSIISSAHQSLCISPIQEYGTELQKSTYLPRLASGSQIGCFALSEPGTGSDAAALSCTVRKDGERYIVKGTKNWITNAREASVCVLFAMQDSSRGNKGITAFVHPMNLPGISVGKNEDKLGIRGSSTASITYDEVVLSQENLLLEEYKGFSVAMSTLNGGRIGVAAQAVGIARASLRDALSYASERKTFGKAIREHQAIQTYLAEMSTHISAARLLYVRAALLKEKKKPYAREAAEAKLFASKTAVMCADHCVQIHGGCGYVSDYPAERHLRDAKITEIYEGTTEIQRLIIAGSL